MFGDFFHMMIVKDEILYDRSKSIFTAGNKNLYSQIIYFNFKETFSYKQYALVMGYFYY